MKRFALLLIVLAIATPAPAQTTPPAQQQMDLGDVIRLYQQLLSEANDRLALTNARNQALQRQIEAVAKVQQQKPPKAPK